MRARPGENYRERIEKYRDRLAAIEEEMQGIWREEHFLALNYRMDIAAKEIERWTAVL